MLKIFESLLGWALAAVLLGIVLCLGMAIPILGGAFFGWLVDLLFGTWFDPLFVAAGLDPEKYHLWQLGALLGFISTFFRSSVSVGPK